MLGDDGEDEEAEDGADERDDTGESEIDFEGLIVGWRKDGPEHRFTVRTRRFVGLKAGMARKDRSVLGQ